MEFGVLFTSHPNPKEEPYPHRDVHARTTDEILEAERLGYDTAWIAEHHFATSYGIMPDCFAYMAYLAAKTSRINIGAAVITLPLYDPIRVVENTSFVDILSNGRVRLGVGSGYRPYEFVGLGKDFDSRRDQVEEAIGLMFDAWHRHRWEHTGKYYAGVVKDQYEMLPHPMQMPHPPLYMAGGTDRSIGYSGRNGFGLMLSTLPSVETLAAQTSLYKRELAQATPERRKNPAAGNIDIARWVYIADTDAEARADTEEAIVRHISHFGGSGTGGYLGSVSEKGSQIKYEDLETTLLHGSAETVIKKLREMQARTGMTSLLLHYPPYYGRDKAMKSLKLFAERDHDQRRGGGDGVSVGERQVAEGEHEHRAFDDGDQRADDLQHRPGRAKCRAQSLAAYHEPGEQAEQDVADPHHLGD